MLVGGKQLDRGKISVSSWKRSRRVGRVKEKDRDSSTTPGAASPPPARGVVSLDRKIAVKLPQRAIFYSIQRHDLPTALG